MAEQHMGVVSQVMGPVIDVRFDEGGLPAINNALTVPVGERTLTVEVLAVQENAGETTVNVNFTGNLAQLARVLKPQIDVETRRKGLSLAKGAMF